MPAPAQLCEDISAHTASQPHVWTGQGHFYFVSNHTTTRNRARCACEWNANAHKKMHAATRTPKLAVKPSGHPSSFRACTTCCVIPDFVMISKSRKRTAAAVMRRPETAPAAALDFMGCGFLLLRFLFIYSQLFLICQT